MTGPGLISRWKVAVTLLVFAGASQPASAQVTGAQMEGIWFQQGVQGPGLLMFLRAERGKNGKPANALIGSIGNAKRDYELKGSVTGNNFVQLHRWIPLDELKKTSEEGKAQAWSLFGDVSQPQYKFLVAPVYFKFDSALGSLNGKITEIGAKYDKTYVFGTKQVDVRFGSKLSLPGRFKTYWYHIRNIAIYRPDFVRKFVRRMLRARDRQSLESVIRREHKRAVGLQKAAESVGSKEQALAYQNVATEIYLIFARALQDGKIERKRK